MAQSPKKEGKKGKISEESAKLLDETAWQLLHALQENARLSFRELGKLVGLAPSTVAERVRRLEDAGILLGYHAEVNLAKVGLSISVFIRMSTPGQNSARIGALLCVLPEVLECYRLAGSEAFLIKAGVSSVKHLEEFIDYLYQYGQPTTTLVLSVPLARRSIEPRM